MVRRRVVRVSAALLTLPLLMASPPALAKAKPTAKRTTTARRTVPPKTSAKPTTTVGSRSAVNVTGSWFGTATNESCAGTRWSWSANLTQTGTTLAGTFNFGGQTFPITGTVSGSTVSLRSATNTIATGFQATVSGSTLRGTYTVNSPDVGSCPYVASPQRGQFTTSTAVPTTITTTTRPRPPCTTTTVAAPAPDTPVSPTC